MPENTGRSRPFKTHATIFEQEVREAVEELRRPAHGHLMSGLIAGIGVGFSALLVGVIVTLAPEGFPDVVTRFLIANAYVMGFVIVVMGRTDLFTEYTTIALLPVLTGAAAPSALLRFWGLVYVANLVGGGLMALAIAAVGPGLGVIDIDRMGVLAHELVDPAAWLIVLSAVLAGWLMGFLSWLVVAAREGISQIAFIWVVGGIIGFGHLHHAITGTIEVSIAVLHAQIDPGSLATFLLWTTLGNVLGGVLFALSIRYSVLRAGNTPRDADDEDVADV